MEGVRSAAVSLMTNSMVAEYDEGVVTAQDIIQAVTASGYGASLPQEKGKAAAPQKDDTMERELASMKRRLIWSFVFLIPLFYISMGHMMGAPLPAFLLGHENAVAFGLTQLLLTLPIMYLNDKYYKVGFKTLWHRAPNMDSLIAVGSHRRGYLWRVRHLPDGLWTGPRGYGAGGPLPHGPVFRVCWNDPDPDYPGEIFGDPL